MARRQLTPEERIAKTISEDVHSSNGLNESLYGHQVLPGDTPVDRLVNHIDQAYMDWDIKDLKFQAVVQKLLGEIPSEQEWTRLIMASSQNSELKKKLLHGVGAAAAVQAVAQQAPVPGAGGQSAAQSGQQPVQGRVAGFKAHPRLRGQGKSGTVYFNRGTKVQLSNIRPHPSNPNVFVGEYISGPSSGMSITFNRKNVLQIV